VRFSPRLVLDGSFLGGGVCPVEGGSGSLTRLLRWGGGRGEGGSGTQLPVTCLSRGGYRVLPWSDLMIRIGRPWNPLLLFIGPGPSLLLHSTRSNTIVIRMRQTVYRRLLQNLHRLPFLYKLQWYKVNSSNTVFGLCLLFVPKKRTMELWVSIHEKRTRDGSHRHYFGENLKSIDFVSC
jgi:hypothetical protein